MAVVTGTDGNQSFATAQDVSGSFSIHSDPNVANSETVPHVSINAVAEAGYDFYVFALSATSIVNFDIDNGMPDFDPWLDLYDSSQNLIASNDDSYPADPGSNHPYDSNFSRELPAGTYYIVVGRYPGGYPDTPMSAGNDYTLHISAANPVPVNIAPVLDLNGPSDGTNVTLSYTEQQGATAMAPLSTVSDADSANFDGGILNIGFATTASSAEQFSIRSDGFGAGQIGVVGNEVKFGNVTIGTITGGAAGGNLVVESKDIVQP